MTKVEIGDATLYHGDCLEILPMLDQVDCIVTDPPWIATDSPHKFHEESRVGGVAKCMRDSIGVKNGDLGEFDKNIILQFKDIAEFDILVLSGYKDVGEVIDALKPVRGIFVWNNSRPVPVPGPQAARDAALIVWSGNKSMAGENGKRWKSCVMKHPSPQAGCMATERVLDDDGSTSHPAQEPLSLFIEMIEPLSGSILDPYMGTGTTGVAAARLGRPFIGIEIDKKYFDIACDRIEKEYSQGKLF